MGNYYSYMRISTKENNDKQSFNRQEKSLKTYAKDNNIEYLLSFKDDTTGGTFNRLSWSKLEKILQKGDTIVFKEISRFTRQAEEGYKKYMELMQKGINLIFLALYPVSSFNSLIAQSFGFSPISSFPAGISHITCSIGFLNCFISTTLSSSVNATIATAP